MTVSPGQTTAAPAGDDMDADGALLSVERVDAGYGAFRAIFSVSFDVAPASAVALLGPNGSGKTTVARVCTGLIRPTAGRVCFAGADVSGSAPHRLARAGIAHAPEGRSVFASLTVEENLVLAFREKKSRTGAKEALARAYELFPRLGERRRQLAGMLSGGEQRMLSLGRVLVLAPRLLVVDELSLGSGAGHRGRGVHDPGRHQTRRHGPAAHRAAGRARPGPRRSRRGADPR